MYELSTMNSSFCSSNAAVSSIRSNGRSSMSKEGEIACKLYLDSVSLIVFMKDCIKVQQSSEIRVRACSAGAYEMFVC